MTAHTSESGVTWGLFMPGADGPYVTCIDEPDALSSLAAGPADAFAAPLDVREAMARAWEAGAHEGLRTPAHLGYALRNPYRSPATPPGQTSGGHPS